MCSTFLQILSIFSSPACYWLQFSRQHAYLAYTVCHCIGQHCSIRTVGVYISCVCQYVAPPGECYYNTLLCCAYFSSSSVVSRTFSALCVYSKFGYHLIPQATFVPNFISFATSIAELLHREQEALLLQRNRATRYVS